jgi:hypothetical protein
MSRTGRRQRFPVLGCLAGWLGIFLVSIALIVFIMAAVQLLTMIPGARRDPQSHFFPAAWAVGLAIGIPAVLDAAVRLFGRRRVAAAMPVRGNEQLARDADSFGTRRVPPGLQELAFVPILLLIPVIVVGTPGSRGLLTGAAVFVGLVVSTGPLFAGLFGGPLFVLAGVLAWLPWAWLTVRGSVGLACVVGLGLDAVLWVAIYRYYQRRQFSRPA